MRFELLILLFDLMNLQSIVVEQDVVLGVETITKVVSLENGLELPEEL
jgi:hypothetical protein